MSVSHATNVWKPATTDISGCFVRTESLQVKECISTETVRFIGLPCRQCATSSRLPGSFQVPVNLEILHTIPFVGKQKQINQNL